jgi:hypothetical protein
MNEYGRLEEAGVEYDSRKKGETSSAVMLTVCGSSFCGYIKQS